MHTGLLVQKVRSIQGIGYRAKGSGYGIDGMGTRDRPANFKSTEGLELRVQCGFSSGLGFKVGVKCFGFWESDPL